MATVVWWPIASLGLQSEGNRGFMWVLTHRHPGVVPPFDTSSVGFCGLQPTEAVSKRVAEIAASDPDGEQPCLHTPTAHPRSWRRCS